MKLSRPVTVALIVILCFASRLPLLLDPELFLDGDECVVSMMAKNLYLGKELPLFFYGQNYGFAFIEVLCIIPFYALLGFTTYAVKLAMLSLWTTGGVFLYLALSQLATQNKWLPMLTTILLIAMPAWAVFSMKAYGGYLTAFTLTSVVYYILFRQGSAEKQASWLWLGILLAVIFQAHILWLAGLAPLLAWYGLRSKTRRGMLLMFVPVILLTAAFHFYKQTLPHFNVSARFNPKDVLGHQLARIPEFVYTSMHGRHELWFHGEAGMPAAVFATIMTVMVFFLIASGIVAFFRCRSRQSLFIWSVIAIGLTLFYTIFTYNIQGKYLLPLSVTVLVSLFVFLKDRPSPGGVTPAFVALSGIGLFCVGNFKIYHWPRTDPRDLSETIKYLDKNGYRHVYSTQGMLAWQIIFYSSEHIIARPYKFPGRVAHYGLEIDSVLNSGGRVAVVGYTDTTYTEFEYPGAERFGGLFVYVNPTKERLQKRFEFREGDIFTPYK